MYDNLCDGAFAHCVCYPAVNVDEGVVSQLVDMGFPRNACIKGVHFSNNTGIEAAMNWIMEHMDDTGKSSRHHLSIVLTVSRGTLRVNYCCCTCLTNPV